MITTGAISISKMMMVNHSLQDLYMSRNNIGDNGISAIAGALGNCKINLLNVGGCDITLHGATMLAAALSSNHTIRVLELKGNAITVEGALLIVKSAVDNTVCQYVNIDKEYFENDEVQKMMEILKDRRRRRRHVRFCCMVCINVTVHGNRNYYHDFKLTSWRKVITQGIDNSVIICDDCYDNRGEELIHEPTGDETMERCLMNQNEDDHSGGQKETRGSRLCCVM